MGINSTLTLVHCHTTHADGATISAVALRIKKSVDRKQRMIL